MGVPSVADFWKLTFRQYEAYTKAHDLRLKEQDHMSWLSGMYTVSAVSLVASEILGGKGKGKYVDAPFLAKEEDRRQSLDEEFLDNPENITPEERKRRAQELFTNLHIFSANIQLRNLRNRLEADKKGKDGDNA